MMTISVPVNSSNKSINAAISCLALDMEGPRRCSSGLIISQEFCQHSSTKLPRRLASGPCPSTVSMHRHNGGTSTILLPASSTQRMCLSSALFSHLESRSLPANRNQRTSTASVQPSCLQYSSIQLPFMLLREACSWTPKNVSFPLTKAI